MPKQIDEDDPDMQQPDEEAVMDTTEKTRQALEKLVSTKISAALPVRAAEKQAPAQYIRCGAAIVINGEMLISCQNGKLLPLLKNCSIFIFFSEKPISVKQV